MPRTSRRLTVRPLTLRDVEVVRVMHMTPGMRKVTLSGKRLCGFTSANGFPQADWLCRDLPSTIPDEQQRARVSVIEQSVFDASPAADAVFISRALKALPDPDAAHALRRASKNRRPGGRVLLTEEVFDTGGLAEYDSEQTWSASPCVAPACAPQPNSTR